MKKITFSIKSNIVKNNSKCNVLMVVPKYETTVNKKNYDYSFPTGLSYIVAVLKKAGYSVDGLNLNHYEGTVKDVLTSFLNQKKYDFVGTGNNALGYNLTKTIIDTVKSHPSYPKTILGGPIITSEPKVIFESIKPDFGVLGEGEDVVLNLLNTVNSKKDLNHVKGIIYSKDNISIMTEKPTPPRNLDALPFPDYEAFGLMEWLDNLHPNTSGSYGEFDYPRIYPLIAGRSCPFQCTFCYHDNNFYRTRSMDNIMEEISLAVKKYRINVLIMQDEIFAINRERIKEFCNRLNLLKQETGQEIKWFAQMRVNGVDEELLKIMKESGCHVVGYGFESFSDTVLKSMRKQITGKEIEKAFFWTRRAGIAVQANFIFGDLAETKETAYETLNWWKKNAMGQIYMDFIQPYPDSYIYRQAIKKGIVKDKLELIKGFEGQGYTVWNLTDKMTDEEIHNLNKEVKESLAKYRKYVSPISIKKTSKGKYSLEITCPYCKTKYTMKNCKMDNRWFFGFSTTCRHCPMHFYITSSLKKVGYRNFDKFKKIRDLQKKLITPLQRIRR